MIEKVAERLYELFLVNRIAVAVQQNDGAYCTKYFNVKISDIKRMLEKQESLGCYQQIYKSKYLKWICFDYDCKQKENPSLKDLYKDCIEPLTKYLDKNSINYATEFSGRRGIHVWIILDELVPKDWAFYLLRIIEEEANININLEKYGLDRFPKTSVYKGNKLGMQVKIPLSVHKGKGGMRSFFFEGEFSYIDYEDSFFENQLKLLNNIKVNSTKYLKERYGDIPTSHKNNTFIRYRLTHPIDCNVDEVITILSEISIYKKIISRIRNGQAIRNDWFVMLGTLGRLEKNEELLLELLKYSPDFSESTTREKIERYSNKYYPPSFEYLFHIYGEKIDEGLDPKSNGLRYLLDRKQLNISLIEDNVQDEMSILNNVKVTYNKEIKYLFENDEAVVINVWNDMLNMTAYDFNYIDNLVKKIFNGTIKEVKPQKFYTFIRQENETKTRKLISLGAIDRILTTHVALRIIYNLKIKRTSYSYNVSFLSSNDIFYNWYSSWSNYIKEIKKYLDFFQDYGIMTIDIKHFYDSIDFIGIYKKFKEKYDIDTENGLKFIVQFNEKLMREINDNKSRLGVPQGPAYARIIAEFFLHIIIEQCKCILKYKNIEILRYVDDIVIVYEDVNIGKQIFNDVERIFEKYGLYFNEKKSKVYGKIEDLEEDEYNEIIRKEKMQYELQTSDDSFLIDDDEIIETSEKYINNRQSFNIYDVNYIFSYKVNSITKEYFINKFGKQIFSSGIGRGSTFKNFYNYVYRNMHILRICMDKGWFKLIPMDSINMYNSISQLYVVIKLNKISQYFALDIISYYVSNIPKDKIYNKELKIMVDTLCHYRRLYDGTRN